VKTLLFLLFSFSVHCQELSMNAFEAQYFHALNEARTNPAGFAQYLEDMRDNYKTKEDGTKIFLYKDAYGENAFYQVEEGISALNEAIEFLQAQEPLRPVKRLAELDMSSHVHLDDQIEGNFFGHYGSDKSAPHQRIERFLFPLGTGENLEYSTTTARMKIIRLIIDDGFRDSEGNISRGHRDAIFTEDYRHVGVACDNYKKSRNILCVANFSSHAFDLSLFELEENWPRLDTVVVDTLRSTTLKLPQDYEEIQKQLLLLKYHENLGKKQ
jgi:uncharacterized protein YkwD